MKKRACLFLVLTVLALVRIFSNVNAAPSSSSLSANGVLQWPMPGHDPQRSSRASEGNLERPTRPLWFRNFNIDADLKGFIPSKVSLVTVAGRTPLEDLILVATSEGLYALRADNGERVWFYATRMPAGNAPTVAGGIAYFGSFDKTIHAVDIETGSKVWQTARAGAGFDTNPLVINDLVYAGCRDGYFYAFKTNDGSLEWSFKTGGKISFSAAASPNLKTIYFASNDGYGYALNALTGALVWKSHSLRESDGKFPGNGFYSFWPVATANHVFFPGSQNYFRGHLSSLAAKEMFPDGREGGKLEDADGWLDAQRILDYFASHPGRRTFFVVNSATGREEMLAPVVWVGNSSGNSYPPAIGPEGYIYNINAWEYGGSWLRGRVSAWQVGTSKIKDSGLAHDAADENGAISIIGNKVFYNHKGAQRASYVDLFSGAETGLWSGRSGIFPEFDEGWDLRKYGDDYSNTPNSSATHGNVNPIVPIRDRICFHSAGSVICFSEDSGTIETLSSRPRRRGNSRGNIRRRIPRN